LERGRKVYNFWQWLAWLPAQSERLAPQPESKKAQAKEPQLALDSHHNLGLSMLAGHLTEASHPLALLPIPSACGHLREAGSKLSGSSERWRQGGHQLPCKQQPDGFALARWSRLLLDAEMEISWLATDRFRANNSGSASRVGLRRVSQTAVCLAGRAYKLELAN